MSAEHWLVRPNEKFEGDDYMKAVKRNISAVWTLDYEIINGKVLINNYSRDDDEGYVQEKTLPKMRLTEKKDRTVTHVTFYSPAYTRDSEEMGNCFEVINSKHILTEGVFLENG